MHNIIITSDIEYKYFVHSFLHTNLWKNGVFLASYQTTGDNPCQSAFLYFDSNLLNKIS